MYYELHVPSESNKNYISVLFGEQIYQIAGGKKNEQ